MHARKEQQEKKSKMSKIVGHCKSDQNARGEHNIKCSKKKGGGKKKKSEQETKYQDILSQNKKQNQADKKNNKLCGTANYGRRFFCKKQTMKIRITKMGETNNKNKQTTTQQKLANKNLCTHINTHKKSTTNNPQTSR